ncbi:MAG: T9SS type A sorting domain-containing protein [Flavobacteriales bacterium]|nr:T9SS type A sorting domain-containing protein [Flavobacteriales bacterium]
MKQFFTLAFLAASVAMFAQVGVVTWELNMANETVSPDGVYLAGGDYFGIPGDNPMSDDDGDGIWTITMAMPIGYTGAYTFTNGACVDWSCKENIVGQSCAFGTWSDRELVEVTGDVTYSTCFAQCTTDGSCNAASDVQVTFRVDMSEAVVTEGVTVFGGSVNGWNNTASPMTDDDGDDVYEYTMVLPSGAHEYKFVNSGVEESFDDSTYTECTLTSGAFTNRILLVEGTDAIVTEAYCYNSCSACQDTTGGGGGGPYEITFNVNMANEEVDPTGVYIAGGADFGVPGDNPMSDDDGDGIYTITVTLDEGYTGHYTFTNGACGDWSCKENLAGLPCGDETNYNDRLLDPVMNNTTISTCFGQCSTDGTCEQNVFSSVTFRVNMADETVTTGVTIFGGSINGWNNTATPLADDDADGIWEVTLDLPAGGHEYKFVNGGSEEIFDAIADGACTVTTADSVYTNRYLLIENSDAITTSAYCFNSCDECAVGVDEISASAFDLFPSVTRESATMRFPVALQSAREIVVVGFSGAMMDQFQIPAGTTTWTMDLSSYAAGIYFVNVQVDGTSSTRKLVKIQ